MAHVRETLPSHVGRGRLPWLHRARRTVTAYRMRAEGHPALPDPARPLTSGPQLRNRRDALGRDP